MRCCALLRVFATRLLALLSLGLAFALPAQAHKASDAYLQLSRSADQLNLRWDISLRDLDAMLDIDPASVTSLESYLQEYYQVCHRPQQMPTILQPHRLAGQSADRGFPPCGEQHLGSESTITGCINFL